MRVLPCDPAQTVRRACGGSALPANRSEPRATARNGFKSRDPGPRQPRPQARRRAQGEAGTERARVQSSVPVPLRQLGCARARLSCVSPRSWLPALPPRPTDAETETESAPRRRPVTPRGSQHGRARTAAFRPAWTTIFLSPELQLAWLRRQVSVCVCNCAGGGGTVAIGMRGSALRAEGAPKPPQGPGARANRTRGPCQGVASSRWP